MFTWKTLSFLSLLGVGYALDTAVSVDFDTDVVFAPADAWHEEYNTACASDDHYTSVINATASLTFTGNRVQVSGLRNNNSGSFSITIDDMATHTYNLQSADVLCELFIDYFLDLGTHNLTLSLSDVNQPAYSIYDGEIWGTNLVLHLTDIVDRRRSYRRRRSAFRRICCSRICFEEAAGTTQKECVSPSAFSRAAATRSIRGTQRARFSSPSCLPARRAPAGSKTPWTLSSRRHTHGWRTTTALLTPRALSPTPRTTTIRRRSLYRR
ncbi:hypothetical protein BC835DRAFT_339923 [Cytidiella melzeri]|nr:hypothetical protein BC835DRAFT_339923 [Cytidiella melzeri]